MRKLTRLLAAVILPAAILSSSVPYIAGASPAKTQKASSVLAGGMLPEEADIQCKSKEEVLEQIDRINSLRRADNYLYKYSNIEYLEIL